MEHFIIRLARTFNHSLTKLIITSHQIQKVRASSSRITNSETNMVIFKLRRLYETSIFSKNPCQRNLFLLDKMKKIL
nr:MAG TPA: hypothetical protein [Caudoviricetes sp.]